MSEARNATEPLTGTFAQHTPGPWVAECVGSGGDFTNPVDVYEVHNGHTRIAEHMTEADARLLEVAPQMLELLGTVTNALAWLNSDDDGHIMELTDRARALIAKATQP